MIIAQAKKAEQESREPLDFLRKNEEQIEKMIHVGRVMAEKINE